MNTERKAIEKALRLENTNETLLSRVEELTKEVRELKKEVRE